MKFKKNENYYQFKENCNKKIENKKKYYFGHKLFIIFILDLNYLLLF